MIDVVVVTAGNRPGLLKQTLYSISCNSAGFVSSVVTATEPERWVGVGALKNDGARSSPRAGQYVLFSDDDMYWMKDWDAFMCLAIKKSKADVLGGWYHPFNPPHVIRHEAGIKIGEVLAVSGNAMLMDWRKWDKYGTFLANSVGPGMSEDWEYSERVSKQGGKLLVIIPPVAVHCGLTNVMGEPATGHREMREYAEKQIRGYKLEGIEIQ